MLLAAHQGPYAGEGNALTATADRRTPPVPIDEDDPSDTPAPDEDFSPEASLHRTVQEGRRRLDRSLLAMAVTGVVGGLDIGTGILAMLVVESQTGSRLLGSLAFSIAFIALLLAQSELFTEGFLVPVTAVVARQSRLRHLLRLWGVTVVANLAGGWFITWLLMIGYPELHRPAVTAATHYAQLGVNGRSFVLAVLAGAAITLLTWMQHGTESVPAKLVAAVAIGFLLAGAQLFHSVLDSLLMFAALHTAAAPFGYLDWLSAFGWSAFGNMVGGLLLVTLLRLLQVPGQVADKRANPSL